MTRLCSRIDIASLSVDEQSKRAFDRILRIVNKREISSSKMRTKLEMAGFCEEAISSSLEEARRLRYIDDVRYSECLIRTTLSMGKGLSRIEHEIRSLGVDIFELESYQQYLEDGEEAQMERALAVLAHHSSRSKNIYASCFRKLISKGFSASIAKSATKKHIDSMADELIA